MKKLPTNVFADSPLRSTDADPRALPASKGKEPQVKPTLHVAPAVAEPSLKTPNESGRSATRKLTVYLPEESVQAIDDEVYLRRKAGERSFSFADMHRELVEEWVARRAKRARSPG